MQGRWELQCEILSHNKRIKWKKKERKGKEIEEKRKPQKTLFYWRPKANTPKAWKQRWSFRTRMTICTGGCQQLSPLHSSWLKSTAAKVSLQDNQHAIMIYYHSTGSMQDMGHKFSLWVQLEDEETHLLKDQVGEAVLRTTPGVYFLWHPTTHWRWAQLQHCELAWFRVLTPDPPLLLLTHSVRLV